jgi:hypothetical protein
MSWTPAVRCVLHRQGIRRLNITEIDAPHLFTHR